VRHPLVDEELKEGGAACRFYGLGLCVFDEHAVLREI
jgi:hypothetical protein